MVNGVLEAKSKVCSYGGCGINEPQPISNFWINNARKDGYNSSCKFCVNLLVSKRPKKVITQKQLDDRKAYNLNRNFKMTPQDYKDLLEKQGNRCSICPRTQCTTGRSFAVDHNHLTGKIRGLLCAHCNTALGLLRVDGGTSILSRALEYCLKT